MKELSIEQKARRYDEAIERANNLHKDAVEMENNMTTKTCEIIFSKLKESEDERIRKAIIEFFELQDDNTTYSFVSKKDILAWLDKHDKPKKVSIWKHWKDGIAGGAEGEQIFLTKIGRIYSISSCLGCECDYIELSELDQL